jgi:hypothetical protein
MPPLIKSDAVKIFEYWSASLIVLDDMIKRVPHAEKALWFARTNHLANLRK